MTYAVYRLCLWLMNKDQMTIYGKRADSHDIVKVVDGYINTSLLHNRSWNHLNKFSKSYLPLKHSYNRKGGIQFSYSYWLNLRAAQNGKMAWKDILLKGEPKTINYKVTRFNDSAYASLKNRKTNETMVHTVGVKCPRIRFGPTYDSIQVELNTIDNPDERFIIRSTSAPGNRTSMRNKAVKLAQDKWALFTFTFEDHTAINKHEDGIVIRFYLNDVLYSSRSIKSAMRPNKSNLHMFPSINGVGGPIQDSRIGNIFYFNYALSHSDIRTLYSRGPPKHMSDMENKDGLGEPLYLSEYNKADVYNT